MKALDALPVRVRRACILGLVLFASATQPAKARQDEPVVILRFDDVRPIILAHPELLPADLTSLAAAAGDVTTESLEAVWPRWLAERSADTAMRLRRADDDLLVNLLLFGTSFTAEPRLTAARLEAMSDGDATNAGTARIDEVVGARLSDLLSAASRPNASERLAYARQVLETRGYSMATREGRAEAATFMLRALARVLREIETYAQVIDQARRLGDPNVEFAQRSKLYASRGLAPDTSLRPNFGIEAALRALQEKGELRGRVARVAIVGPGLDFADKQEGYDIYPLQTIQPFALVDTLRRLGLSAPENLRVTTLDISPNVNAHVASLATRASGGSPYIVHLPLDGSEQWTAGFLKYWETFGDHVGRSVAVDAPTGPTGGADVVRMRAVEIDRRVLSTMTPVVMNIVSQRLDLASDERFDLIVGTNVFLYYDEFPQALAMLNVERMLKPGGFLLSNNAVVDLPSSRMRLAGHVTVSYSARRDDGDVMIWYQKERE